MKKLTSILLVLLILTAALALAGCGEKDPVAVSSVMKIDSSFKGTRTVTVLYPLDADVDAVKDRIIAHNPYAAVDGVTFTNKGVRSDGYCFELAFVFDDKEEYEEQVKAVVGASASCNLFSKNTDLTRGIRMKENFSVSDLIAWIVSTTASESATADLEFKYDDNSVTIDNKTYATGSMIDINKITGTVVSSVSIVTTNNKNDRFDRTIEFAIPTDSYTSQKAVINQYFSQHTPAAAASGWQLKAASQVYRVELKNQKLTELRKNTNLLLDTDSVSISYRDADDDATPLAEGLDFDESLDVFSFCGPALGFPHLSYTYRLPQSTEPGVGALYQNGKWTRSGIWESDGDYQAYRVDIDSGSMHLRVSDGIQYRIEGIDIRLESLGSERFRRTTDFVYEKRDGSGGAAYAAEFFTSKGAQATALEEKDRYVCSVVLEGTTTELTVTLAELFGVGNFMTYSKDSGGLSLATRSAFTDYVSFDAILDDANAEKPIRYFFDSSGAENIVSVTVDGEEKAYTSMEESFVTLTGSSGTVEYYGSIPITWRIILYIVIGLILLVATIIGAYLMINYRRSGLSPGAQHIVDAVGLGDDAHTDLASLSQTTTFSLAELGILRRNKTYVDEINRDVDSRIELDRITDRHLNARRQEPEKPAPKSAEAPAKPKAAPAPPRSPLDDVPELDIDVLKAAVAKTSDPRPAYDEPDDDDGDELNLDVLKAAVAETSGEPAGVPDEEPDEEPALLPAPEKPSKFSKLPRFPKRSPKPADDDPDDPDDEPYPDPIDLTYDDDDDDF